MQCAQIPEYSDINGSPQTLHDAPEYFAMVDQQVRQKGATDALSVRQEQAGQVDG